MNEPKDMFDTEETRNHPMFLDIARMMSFHRESGRLEIRAGTTRGAFFFDDGKLVYAHMGCLTGFQAVNAAVSMADAHFSFDPGIPPLTPGALTLTERNVLKKLYSIETANPEACTHRPSEKEIDWDSTPAPVVPLTDAEVSELSVKEPENNAAYVLGSEEKTSSINRQISRFEERAEPGISERETPALSAIQPAAALKYSEDEIGDGNKHAFVRPKSANSKPWKSIPYQVVLTIPTQYRRVLAFAIVLALMAAGAVALVKKLSDLRLPTQVAKQSVTSETVPNDPSESPSGQPSPVKQIEPSKVAHSTGTWLIILSTFTKAERSKANEKLDLLRSLAYDVHLVDTDQYPNLKKGFLAIVMGPQSKDAAKNALNKVRLVAPGSYLKSGW
jgi:hypothetical protein